MREFRLLLGAQGVSEIGDRMAPIALAFAVLELGGGATEVGLVLACRMFPLIATLLVGGVVADRVSRRDVMVVADLLRVLTQGLMAALLIAGAAEIWMLARARRADGRGGRLLQPGRDGRDAADRAARAAAAGQRAAGDRALGGGDRGPGARRAC